MKNSRGRLSSGSWFLLFELFLGSFLSSNKSVPYWVASVKPATGSQVNGGLRGPEIEASESWLQTPWGLGFSLDPQDKGIGVVSGEETRLETETGDLPGCGPRASAL